MFFAEFRMVLSISYVKYFKLAKRISFGSFILSDFFTFSKAENIFDMWRS